jgi:O-antigen/teichoic acid export membrane protein
LSAYARVVQSILTLGAGQVLTWIGAVVLLVLLPRYLGDENLGKLTFAWALTALFGIVADLGVTTFLAKEIARDRTLVGPLLKSVLVSRLPLSAFAAGGAAAFVTIAGYDEVTRQIVYVLSLGIVVGSFANVLGAALQGLQRMRALTASMATGKLLQSGLVAALLLNGAGPLEVAITTVFATTVGMAISGIALRRELSSKSPISRTMFAGAVAGGLPFFVGQAALMFYGQIDFVLLGLLTRDAVVGWYAAAYRLIMLPAFIPIIVTTAVLPALSALSRDPAQFGGLARRSLQLIALATVPMAFGILMIPDKLVHFLGYPAGFSNSIAPMMLLALHVPLAGIDMVIGTVLATTGRQRQWAMTAVAAALLNPAANMIAIPLTEQVYGNGAIGAAFITTLTELFMLVVGLRLLPRGIVVPSTVAYVARCVFAALCMSVDVLVVREAPLPVTVVLGAATYVAASLVVGTLLVSDLRKLGRFLVGRVVPTSQNQTGEASA